MHDIPMQNHSTDHTPFSSKARAELGVVCTYVNSAAHFFIQLTPSTKRRQVIRIRDLYYNDARLFRVQVFVPEKIIQRINVTF